MDKKDLWTIYDENKEWIKFADAKAIAFIAVIGVIFNILYSIKDYVYCADSLVIKGGYIITFIFFSLSLFSSVFCLIPRTSKSDNNIIYYKSISEYYSNEKEYVDEIKIIEEDKFKEQISVQIYQLAKVANKKYRIINWSLTLFCLGILTFLIFSILVII
ncbi:MAG: hypothetical protein E7Z84_05820 [Methanosphaera stadtmanae]|nr:hypothetical protein [Methanosphaera stadtmanae]